MVETLGHFFQEKKHELACNPTETFMCRIRLDKVLDIVRCLIQYCNFDKNTVSCCYFFPSCNSPVSVFHEKFT